MPSKYSVYLFKKEKDFCLIEKKYHLHRNKNTRHNIWKSLMPKRSFNSSMRNSLGSCQKKGQFNKT